MTTLLNIFSSGNLGMIGLVIICFLLLLGLIVLISFHKTRKATVITIFMAFSLLIVGGMVILFVWPSSPTRANSEFSLNFYNKDPELENVKITIPQALDSSNPTTLSLNAGTSQEGITVLATSTITAKGYRIDSNGNKINYDLNYTFNNITNNNVYYTTGGVQTDNTYLDLTVDNQSSSPVTLYTSDINNNVYPCCVIPVGPSVISSYMGQFYSLNSQGTEGIIIPSTNVLLLFIGAELRLLLKDLPSSNVIIENGTSIKGVLQSLDSWKVGVDYNITTWKDKAIITSGKGVKSIIYIDQWWRIVDDKRNPITDVYIISEDDIGISDPIVLN